MDDRFVFRWREEPKSEVLTETFGQRLKRIRKERKLTQKEFAKKVGIGNDHICEYEHDKHIPNIVVLEWLCKALGVSATELLGF